MENNDYHEFHKALAELMAKYHVAGLAGLAYEKTGGVFSFRLDPGLEPYKSVCDIWEKANIEWMDKYCSGKGEFTKGVAFPGMKKN